MSVPARTTTNSSTSKLAAKPTARGKAPVHQQQPQQQQQHSSKTIDSTTAENVVIAALVGLTSIMQGPSGVHSWHCDICFCGISSRSVLALGDSSLGTACGGCFAIRVVCGNQWGHPEIRHPSMLHCWQGLPNIGAQLISSDKPPAGTGWLEKGFMGTELPFFYATIYNCKEVNGALTRSSSSRNVRNPGLLR